MTYIETKPCPICGGFIGTANFEVDSVGYYNGHRMGIYKGVFICSRCQSEIHITGDSHKDLIKKWNELPRAGE